MEKIYDLSYDDVVEITQEIIENNDELQALSQENMEIQKALESIFYIKDTEVPRVEFLSDEEGYFGCGAKASLYVRDSKHHICAKSIVIDFIKVVFSQQGWKIVKNIYCQIKNISGENITIADLYIIISKIREAVVKNIIKLTDENFCIYLQIITHFREHGKVTLMEIVDWIPDFMGKCCWEAADWKCQFCEDDRCMLKRNNNCVELVHNELEKMVRDRLLLVAVNDSEIYKINY